MQSRAAPPQYQAPLALLHLACSRFFPWRHRCHEGSLGRCVVKTHRGKTVCYLMAMQVAPLGGETEVQTGDRSGRTGRPRGHGVGRRASSRRRAAGARAKAWAPASSTCSTLASPQSTTTWEVSACEPVGLCRLPEPSALRVRGTACRFSSDACTLASVVATCHLCRLKGAVWHGVEFMWVRRCAVGSLCLVTVRVHDGSRGHVPHALMSRRRA